MKTIDLYLGFTPYQEQDEVLSDGAQFKVVAAGRRSGKTLMALRPLTDAAVIDHLPAGYFAPSYKKMDEVWEEHKVILAPVIVNKDEQLRILRILGGGRIDYWTMEDENAGRSRRYKRIVIDEAGEVANLKKICEESIFPTLTDFNGSAQIQGTPRGHNGFWQFYQRGIAENRMRFPEWKSFQYSSHCNPFLPRSFLDMMQRTLPQRVYEQEYLAQFLSDNDAVFRHVRERATAIEQDRAIPGHMYTFGVDYARTGDFSVITVYDATLRSEVKIDRSQGIEFEQQRGRLYALWELFRPESILVEDNAMGLPIVEQLFKEGLPVVAWHTGNATKAILVDELALGFERNTFTILPDEGHIGELQAYEATRTASGLWKYAAPEGMHDDTVMGLMLAYHAAQETVLGEAGLYIFN